MPYLIRVSMYEGGVFLTKPPLFAAFLVASGLGGLESVKLSGVEQSARFIEV